MDLNEYIGDMYRKDDYPELNGKEPDWVQSERDMFKDHRDKNGDGKLDTVITVVWLRSIWFILAARDEGLDRSGRIRPRRGRGQTSGRNRRH